MKERSAIADLPSSSKNNRSLDMEERSDIAEMPSSSNNNRSVDEVCLDADQAEIKEEQGEDDIDYSLDQKRITEEAMMMVDYDNDYSLDRKRITEALKDLHDSRNGMRKGKHKQAGYVIPRWIEAKSWEYPPNDRAEIVKEPVECPYDLSEYCLNNDKVCPDADQAEIKEEGEDHIAYSLDEKRMTKALKMVDYDNDYSLDRKRITVALKGIFEESYIQKSISNYSSLRNLSRCSSKNNPSLDEVCLDADQAEIKEEGKVETVSSSDEKRITELLKRFGYSSRPKRIAEAQKRLAEDIAEALKDHLDSPNGMRKGKHKGVGRLPNKNMFMNRFLSQIKKEYTAIDIEGNVAVDGDPDMTQSHLRVHKEHARPDLFSTVFAGQLAMASCLGNPLDLLSKWESTGKAKEQSPLNFKEALLVLLPPIIWTTMFFMSFIYTTILSPPFDSRLLANSMQLLLLPYYILVLASTYSGSSVLWGSMQMPALLFVSGGVIGLMLLIGPIIMLISSYFARRFSKVNH